MSRTLTPASTLENLKLEARRWLKALRGANAEARRRFERSHPHAPMEPTLRAVQHALAREYGFPEWAALKRAVAEIEAQRTDGRTDSPIAQLLEAAGKGDVARVRALLDEHPGIVNERAFLAGNTGRRTALHYAIAHHDVVELLLDRGADPNIRDEGDDAMPLHFAAERGDLDVVKLLIGHGADAVGEGTVHELNVLGWAVCWDYTHHADVAEYLLAHGARHTMHTAVALGDVNAIRALAARSRADIDRPMDRTNLRRHPFHLAVVKRQLGSLAALLELGADTEAEDAAGLTPLDQAALDGEREMVELLLEHGARLSLPAAIALDRGAEIERLLSERPDDLKPGGRYGTLIVRAARRAPGHVVRALIRAGADVNVRDATTTSPDEAEGYTPLHEAAFHGNVEAVRVLLEHGADPNVRDGKWCAPPAGWANYASQVPQRAGADHIAARDAILASRIDLFQAVDFDRIHRIPGIARQSPWLLERTFSEYASCGSREDRWWPEPWHTPLVWAVVRNKADAVRVLLEQGASQRSAPDGRTLLGIARELRQEDIASLLLRHRRIEETHEGRVRWFIRNACPDHHIRGGPAHVVARNTAERLLHRHPEIARDSLYTAVVCGDIEEVERALAERPALANERGGPKGWTPLLYLCFTRLPSVAAIADNAVAIARLVLDHGADPNAYFMAGDSRYTPLVGAIGEGEEDRPAHARRDALVRLLLERGAEPYDSQVLYNIHFHGNVLWFLKLIHEHSLRLGRGADWEDPEWHMLDMGGYGTGARYVLGIAVKRNDLALAEWALSRGANPESPPETDERFARISLHEAALRLGHTGLADLLVRHGAKPATVAQDDEDVFVTACLRLDRERVRALVAEHPEYLRSPRAMHEAAKQDRADVVSLLLDLGVPTEIENEKKQRPLHQAAYAGALRVAELLIERGAEIDPVETQWHNTPLDFAVYAQHARMIELLSRHSRDIWNLTFTGNAARVGDMLEADPERARVVSSRNETPLMWLPDDEAAAIEIIELFLARGAAAGARDANGLTAADHASRRGLEEAAALLSVHEAADERDSG